MSRLYTLPIVAFLTIAACLGVVPAPQVIAQPVIYDIQFHQLDWYDFDGSLVKENSLWGQLSFSYVPDDYTWYLNLTLQDPINGSVSWAVQNLPLFFVDNGDYSPRRESAYINLEWLGYTPSQEWSVVDCEIAVDYFPQQRGPSPVTFSYDVLNQIQWVGELFDESPLPGPFTDPGGPIGVQPGQAPAAVQNDGRTMNPVQEAVNHCCAGAFARSLDWLNREHNLGINKTAQQIYDALVAAGVSQPAPGSPDRDDWVSAKNQYARNQTGNNIVTKVWDRGSDMPAVDGVPETSGNFVDWLRREMEQGEDVEIAYFYEGGAHIVTATRVYTQNGQTYVKYRDDESQGHAAAGDSTVKTARIYEQGGQQRFGSNGNTIYFAVSESRVQEPVVSDDGDVTWQNPGDPSSNSSLDNRPIHDIVPPYGGSLEFYWTMGRYVPGETPQQHPGYKKYTETNDSSATRHRSFRRPNDPTITDWYQRLTSANGASAVYGGTIRHNSPWEFYSLEQLPDVDFRIPDFAPTFGDPALTIYTAVNLEEYLLLNPEGPLGGAWGEGDTLNSLGLVIENGRIPGVEGIYFSITDFTFDPYSETGWIPQGGPEAWLNSEPYQMEYGDIAILAAHVGEADPVITDLPWYENFDSYLSGRGLQGRGGWSGRFGESAYDAVVTHVMSLSEPLACEISTASDVVRSFEGADAGIWYFTTWQYIPSEFAAGIDPFEGAYLAMINSTNSGGPYNYSVKMNFDSNDGMLKVYYGNGLNTVNIPYIPDEWIMLQVAVDLNANRTYIYYDEELVVEYPWTGGIYGDGTGRPNIAAVELCAGGASPIYYDDISLELVAPPCPGDLDQDYDVDLSDLAQLLSNYGMPEGADCEDGDLDWDGDVDLSDLAALLSVYGDVCE